MKVPELSDEALTAAFAAMKMVAGGPDGLSEADQITLRASWHWLYGQDQPLNLDFLAPIDGATLAARVTEPASRTWVAHSLAVLPFVDGKLDAARMKIAADFGNALGVREDFVNDLSEAAKGHLQAVLACMVRENVISFHDAKWPGNDAMAYFLPYRDKPDPALVARHEALGSLSPETLGHQYHAWYRRNQFPFPGEPMGLFTEFAWSHDSAHLLSGYNTTPHGELLVSTFTAGMHPDYPMEAHILPVIFSWNLGIKMNDIAKSATGAFDPELFWEAWDRGANTTTDVFLRDWDFWAACEQPLATLRVQYGVPPSAFPWDRVSA